MTQLWAVKVVQGMGWMFSAGVLFWAPGVIGPLFSLCLQAELCPVVQNARKYMFI